MTTHHDSDDRLDSADILNACGEIVANLSDLITATLPPHWKAAADVVVTLLPYAGTIGYGTGRGFVRLLTRPLRRRA